MGQYYTPVLIDADGTIRTLYSHDYGNGLKLMEHSYIGNDFVEAVLTQLWERPQRLAWIGDYSNDYQGDLYETKLARNGFMKYYNAAWEDGRDVYRIHPEAKPVITMRHKNRYLINHTQKVYIRIGEYIAANKWQEKGAFVRGKYDPFLAWQKALAYLIPTVCAAEEKTPEQGIALIRNFLFYLLYLDYDVARDFLPQFVRNTEKARQFMDQVNAALHAKGNQP